MTPREFARDFIVRWEDGGSSDPAKTHSMDRTDPGNWSTGKQGQGQLIGSNHGVTPAVLAAHRKLSVLSISYDVMHALTVDEAATIALDRFYYAPKLDLLTWGPTTASLMDFGWGAGPAQAIKLAQRLVDVADDGMLGPVSAKAWNGFLAQVGEPFAAGAWWQVRNTFYDTIIAANGSLAKYRNGWRNRSRYYAPGHPEGWWARFAA